MPAVAAAIAAATTLAAAHTATALATVTTTAAAAHTVTALAAAHTTTLAAAAHTTTALATATSGQATIRATSAWLRRGRVRRESELHNGTAIHERRIRVPLLRSAARLERRPPRGLLRLRLAGCVRRHRPRDLSRHAGRSPRMRLRVHRALHGQIVRRRA